jgi:sodium transport system permease protein
LPGGARTRRGSRLNVVLRKELREIFRDKRTVFSVIISPLIITPLLIAGIGGIATRQAKKDRVETLPVGIVGAARAPSIQDVLKGPQGLRIENVTQAEAETAIRERRLRAVAVLPPETERLLKENREVRVQILVDVGNQTSQGAARRLQEFFMERGRRLVAKRLVQQGLPSELATPFSVTEKPIAPGGSRASFMLALFLPYVLVFGALIGGIYAANDMVAGEKERGTLEALLVTPAARRDLVMGKFLAVAWVSLVNSVLSVTGIMIPFFVRIPGLDWMAASDLKLGAWSVIVLFLVQLPLAVLGAGTLLAISTYARNQKEAQSYLPGRMLWSRS